MIKTTKYKYKTFISWDFSSAKLYFCTSYCWEACTALFFFFKAAANLSYISTIPTDAIPPESQKSCHQSTVLLPGTAMPTVDSNFFQQ